MQNRYKYILAIIATLMLNTAKAQKSSTLSVLDFFYPLPANQDSAKYSYQFSLDAKPDAHLLSEIEGDLDGYTFNIEIIKKDDKISWQTYKILRDCCVGPVGTEQKFYRYDEKTQSIRLTKHIVDRKGKGVGKGTEKLTETNSDDIILMMPGPKQVLKAKKAIFSDDANYQRKYIKNGTLVFCDTTYSLNSVPSRFINLGQGADVKNTDYDTLITNQLPALIMGYDKLEFSRESLPQYGDCIKVKLRTLNEPRNVLVCYYAKGKGLVKTHPFALELDVKGLNNRRKK